MEGMNLGERNKAGEKVLDFATSYELVIINTCFWKREEHYITYVEEIGHRLIILCGRGTVYVKRVKYCKIIPGESVITRAGH